MTAPIDVPPAECPVASVIVLAWRCTDPLLACLRALVDSRPEVPYELLVVLNGATPEVRRLVAGSLRGAVVLDSEVNLGFAAGCNLAAVRARGEHLVFLNDDAAPEPGWLDSLVEVVRADEEVDAVSSRLHFPDGRLQEAGCRVLSDGTGSQTGWGLAECPPELLVPRDVDYGSAAALLVRRKAFERVGGYDAAFDPAYFEDADLAFRLRGAGGRVRYEPRAVAVHLQHGSTAQETHLRDFAWERSAALFASRWREVLATAPSVDDPWDRLCLVPAVPVVDGPPALASVDVSRKALQWREEYSVWLAQRLDASHVQLRLALEQLDESAALASRLAVELSERETRAAAQSAAATGQAEELSSRVHDLTGYITQLEQLRPVQLLGWRIHISLRSRPQLRRTVRSALRRGPRGR